MKTIAIIASCDTKHKEAAYIKDKLGSFGLKTLVVDISIGSRPTPRVDISREEVFRSAGHRWELVRGKSKGELMELVVPAVRECILGLYQKGLIHGVLAVGGLQNTTAAVHAMQALPIGFPTVMATTVASGQKQFGDVVGDKDIVVIPSISDFTGINSITSAIIDSACACMAGMVSHGCRPVSKPYRPSVGISLMGITNTGACAAVDELERMGVEAIGFHSTGVGGRIMENLAEEGILDGILDFTTHEITSEFFGGGYSYGASDRLIKPAKLGIPMVVAPGGLDFVDFPKWDFPERMDERVYNMHNAVMAHIKILPDEAELIGEIVAKRLNMAKSGVRLILPTEGMRQNTRLGENLYCTETDDALLGAIRRNINENVRLEVIPGNCNDEQWGRAAARAMHDELCLRGVIE